MLERYRIYITECQFEIPAHYPTNPTSPNWKVLNCSHYSSLEDLVELSSSPALSLLFGSLRNVCLIREMCTYSCTMCGFHFSCQCFPKPGDAFLCPVVWERQLSVVYYSEYLAESVAQYKSVVYCCIILYAAFLHIFLELKWIENTFTFHLVKRL